MTIQAQLTFEIKAMSPDKAREVLDFARFLRLRPAIDADQAYFWTRKWQAREKGAERDKKCGRAIGDGTVKGLAKALGR